MNVWAALVCLFCALASASEKQGEQKVVVGVVIKPLPILHELGDGLDVYQRVEQEKDARAVLEQRLAEEKKGRIEKLRELRLANVRRIKEGRLQSLNKKLHEEGNDQDEREMQAFYRSSAYVGLAAGVVLGGYLFFGLLAQVSPSLSWCVD